MRIGLDISFVVGGERTFAAFQLKPLLFIVTDFTLFSFTCETYHMTALKHAYSLSLYLFTAHPTYKLTIHFL